MSICIATYVCTYVRYTDESNCTITPISPTNLTISDGVLSVDYGTENVTIQCSCSSGNDSKWFGPNGGIINETSVANAPYFIKNFDGKSVVLIIPTFNDSYDGNYSCGFESNFPPKQPIDVYLTFGKYK